jgi:hypothetical protein
MKRRTFLQAMVALSSMGGLFACAPLKRNMVLPSQRDEEGVVNTSDYGCNNTEYACDLAERPSKTVIGIAEVRHDMPSSTRYSIYQEVQYKDESPVEAIKRIMKAMDEAGIPDEFRHVHAPNEYDLLYLDAEYCVDDRIRIDQPMAPPEEWIVVGNHKKTIIARRLPYDMPNWYDRAAGKVFL